MTKIVGISGSLRKASFNTGLLIAAGERLPEGVRLEIATIRGIPLYDGDAEDADGIPPAVAALKTAMISADGILLATPEYNSGIPGVLKNAMDWASRPPSDSAKVLGNKPVAIIGASPGNFGTILAQNHWLPVMRTLGARLWSGGRLMVTQAGMAFDAEGRLTDDATRQRLQVFMAGFAAFVRGG